MKRIYMVFLVVVFFITGCGGSAVDGQLEEAQMPVSEEERETDAGQEEADLRMEEYGTYAVMEISAGGESPEQVVIELFEEETPNTVENFIGLAAGEKEYRDPEANEWVKGNFYDGLTFHRIIAGFMIQGGDPLGTGRGGPGYQFDCEIVEGLSFDRPGRLAMANSGPNTNGSQFFITVAPTPWLDGNHTIFGQVKEGMDVVKKISGLPTQAGDRPVEPVVIESVEIREVQGE